MRPSGRGARHMAHLPKEQREVLACCFLGGCKLEGRRQNDAWKKVDECAAEGGGSSRYRAGKHDLGTDPMYSTLTEQASRQHGLWACAACVSSRAQECQRKPAAAAPEASTAAAAKADLEKELSCAQEQLAGNTAELQALHEAAQRHLEAWPGGELDAIRRAPGHLEVAKQRGQEQRTSATKAKAKQRSTKAQLDVLEKCAVAVTVELRLIHIQVMAEAEDSMFEHIQFLQ
eukprot:1159536-Pelagomonas_calceolata.AAC.5